MKKLLKKWHDIPIAVKVSVAYAVCSILQKCLSIITLPLFTRILTTEQYGQYSVYTSWSALIVIFVTLNLSSGSFSTAMIKYENAREKYIASVQGITLLLGALFLLIYFPLRNILNPIFELPTPLVVLMIAEIIAVCAMQCWNGKQRFLFRYKAVVAITLLISLVSPILGYFAVINTEEKGYARIFVYAFVNIVIGGALFVFNLIKGKTLFKWEYWKYALTFNIPLIMYYLSQVVFNQSDRIMISHYCGIDKAGIYSVAYTLSILLTFALTAINNSYVPWLYENMKREEYAKNRPVSIKLSVLVAVLLLAIIWLAPEAIYILAGADYYEAIWIVPPVAMSVLLLFYAQIYINIEFFFEKKKFLVGASVGAAVVNIILNALLIPVFGYYAAGYTTLVSYIIFAGMNYRAVQKTVREEEVHEPICNTKAMAVIFIIFAILSFGAMALYTYTLVRMGIIAVVLLVALIMRKKIIELVKKP